MVDIELPEARSLLEVCTRMMNTIQDIPQVVIAKVHALATAAGCQLVSTCDMAVAAESAGLLCREERVACSAIRRSLPLPARSIASMRWNLRLPVTQLTLIPPLRGVSSTGSSPMTT